MNAPPEDIVAAAVRAARCVLPSGQCRKSRRGAAIWDTDVGDLLAVGTNYLPGGATCDLSDRCRKQCGVQCVHAEQQALLRLGIPTAAYPSELDMLHVKVVDGALVASGPPSCWQCSKLIVGRVGGMWLYHANGWRRYDAQEFHALTLQHHRCTDEKTSPAE